MQEILIETRGIRKLFEGKTQQAPSVSAVNKVSLSIPKGSAVGLVGESGSGKSTLGRMMTCLERPTEGQVLFRGDDISTLSHKQLRPFRRHIQMVFQNSAGVFDPAYTIGQSIQEVLRNNGVKSPQESREKAAQILEQTGLDPSYLDRYALELSGGQRQRANIARALALHPEFVVCDEPVSSLDYSLRKQALDLLNQLRETLKLTYLFITHDLECVPYVCDQMAIMYAGRILETLDLSLYAIGEAKHPYTKLLLSSLPVKNPHDRVEKFSNNRIHTTTIPDKRACCRFHERCEEVFDRCRNETPELRERAPGHCVACHLFE